ncbi:MAG: AAA family ATPase [Candidatus Heimdallarchaeaceae archaeon]
MIKASLRKPKKIYLEFKNFGPISEGKIEIKPLTILIGPNNSGKSYVAVLAKSIIRNTKISKFYEVFRMIEPSVESFINYVLDEDLKKLEDGIDTDSPLNYIVNKLSKMRNDETWVIDEKLVADLVLSFLDLIFVRTIHDEIERMYGSQIQELIKFNRRNLNFNFILGENIFYFRNKKDKLDFELDTEFKFTAKVRRFFDQDVKFTLQLDKSNKPFIFYNTVKGKEDFNFAGTFLIIRLTEYYVNRMLDNHINQTFYLPAARSGILQGHKALTANIMEKIPLIGTKRFDVPSFTGAASDFISFLIRIDRTNKSEYYELATQFEQELLSGEILLKDLESKTSPEIMYKIGSNEIPIHRASSTVNELAPLLLYLKYDAKKGNLLIFEEPEAHLHPENQRILSKYIVRLIRSGLNILITTHSEYILEQISSFLLMEKIKPEDRVLNFQYSINDYLKPKEVSAYVFKYDKRSNGYKTYELDISDEDGISQEEFVKVHEALYNEFLKLTKKTEDFEKG